MPTGYTADLYDGEQAFEDFILRCARGMGALVTMRDEPWDAPIPDEFPPSDYHDGGIAKARAALRELDAMSPAEADRRAKAEYDEAVARDQEAREKRAERRQRYEAMLAKVQAWEPPTADHIGFKDFMEQQLQESIKFDCGDGYPEPKRMYGQEWVERRREQAQRDVAYHTAEREKEIQRAAARTAWVKALRESLGVAA